VLKKYIFGIFICTANSPPTLFDTLFPVFVCSEGVDEGRNKISYPHSVNKGGFGEILKLKCMVNKNIGLVILESKFNIGYRQVKKTMLYFLNAEKVVDEVTKER